MKLSCIVGADELPEFVRQSGIVANIWSGFGVDTGSWQVAGRHHFDIIDDLHGGIHPLRYISWACVRCASYVIYFYEGDRKNEINKVAR